MLGIIASSIERLSTEIRHLQRTEVLEVEEFFEKKQKGSSAMPHKRNPIMSENLSGISRYIRSTVIPSMENISLWHERDISHSSVERIIAPDSNIAMDFALTRLTEIIKKMIVYPRNMQKNLERLGGLLKSQDILLALTKKNVSRQRAYKIVQSAANKAWKSNIKFESLLLEDPTIKKLFKKIEIKKILDDKSKLKHINKIFKDSFQKT